MSEKIASLLIRLFLRDTTLIVDGGLTHPASEKATVPVTPQLLVATNTGYWYIRHARNIASTVPNWCFMHRLPASTLTIKALVSLLLNFGFEIEQNTRDQEERSNYRATLIVWYNGSVVGSIAKHRGALDKAWSV